jgi:hypothetical protein
MMQDDVAMDRAHAAQAAQADYEVLTLGFRSGAEVHIRLPRGRTKAFVAQLTSQAPRHEGATVWYTDNSGRVVVDVTQLTYVLPEDARHGCRAPILPTTGE